MSKKMHPALAITILLALVGFGAVEFNRDAIHARAVCRDAGYQMEGSTCVFHAVGPLVKF